MLCIEPVRDTTFDLGQPIPGVTEGGVMSLVLSPDQLAKASVPTRAQWVYGRGLMDPDPNTSRSCLISGTIANHQFRARRVFLTPITRPHTEDGHQVYGYECPTRFPGNLNFIEPGREAVLGTEAWKDAEDRVRTHIFYLNPLSREYRTFFTPDQAKAAGLKVTPSVHSVKEPQLWFLPNRQLRIFMEVSTDCSFIALGKVEGDRVTNLRPWLYPKPGTWYAEHCSPGGNPIPLANGEFLVVINGRQDNIWRIGCAVVNHEGKFLWISPEPFITPPMEEPPGPKGQYIAFASDANGRWVPKANGIRRFEYLSLQVYYHAQDRYCKQFLGRVFYNS